jgi:phage terminase large subunit-like protein
VEAALAKWQPEYMGIEKATYGSALLQRCARRGLKVRPMLADRDKVTRAAPAASMVAQHRVFFPRGVEWVPEWTHECLSFPNGKHDDQVDTLSYAAIEVDRRTFNQHTKTLEVGLTQHEKIWSQIAKDKKARRRHPTLGRW